MKKAGSDNTRETLQFDAGASDLDAARGVVRVDAAAVDAEWLAQVERVVDPLVRVRARDALKVIWTPA